MKKLFTFLTLALMSIGSAWADVTIVFDAAAAGWSADGVNLATGTTTVGDATWNGGGSASIATGSATIEGVSWDARLKFGGGSTFKSGKALARVLTFTPSAAGTVKVYGTHGSSSGTRTFYISQSITSTDRDVNTALGSYACTPENKSGVATAAVEKGKMVYIWADNNIGIYGVTFEASSAPSISATDASITATSSGVEVTQDIDVTGTNLTGSTLTATLSPAVAGLSVTLGSSTITAGAISTTATLHYTQTANAKGTTTLTLSDGTTSKDVTITYRAAVIPWTLQPVSAATTWDFSKLTGGVQYGGDNLKVERVYANIPEITAPADFDDMSLAFTGEYPLRSGKSCAQNGTLKFITTVPGTITVDFSDTGSSSATGPKRYLKVNDVVTDQYTLRNGTTDRKVSDPIIVPAGVVTINAWDYDAVDLESNPIPGGAQIGICVYKIIFTPSTDGNDVVEIGQYEWATRVAANDLDFTGSAVKAYIVTGHSGNAITAKQVNKVAAGTPILLNAAKGSYVIPASFTGSADATTGNLLKAGTGTAVAKEDGKTKYVLSADGSKAVFKKINETAATVAAGKAYLEFAEVISARLFSLDETTGISDAARLNDNVEMINDKVYDLQGRKVAQPTKGLYIVNGKKVIIK